MGQNFQVITYPAHISWIHSIVFVGGVGGVKLSGENLPRPHQLDSVYSVCWWCGRGKSFN